MRPFRLGKRDVQRVLAVAWLACFGVAWPGMTGAQPIPAQWVSSDSVVCKDTLFVDFVVDATGRDLRGFTFVFEFDPTYVTPVSVERGALMTGAGCGSFFTWINSASVGDSIWVDGATLGCSMNGVGSIVRIGFVAGGTQGTSPLRCRSGSMRNSLNQPLPYTCPDGAVRHSCPVAVERRAWTHVKILFR